MIVKMKRLRLFAFEDDKAGIIRDMMHLGCVEISEAADDVTDDIKGYLVPRQEESDLSALHARMKSALAVLDKYIRVKTGLFAGKPPVSEAELDDEGGLQSAEESVVRVESLAGKIAGTHSDESQLSVKKLTLLPWKTLDMPLESTETARTETLLATLPENIPQERIENALREKTDEYILHIVDRDAQVQYLTLTAFKDDAEELTAALKPMGFARIYFNGYTGTLGENIEVIDGEIQRLQTERKEAEEYLRQMGDDKENIRKFYDAVGLFIVRQQLKDQCVNTGETFALLGWVPEEKMDAVSKKLECYACAYEYLDPTPEQEPPVLVKNSKLVAPFGIITEMYSLPSYRGIDPNPVMSFFYFNIFGMMLSDAGYGLILTIACGFLLYKYKIKGNFGRFLQLFFLLGISTTFWGAMFGGFFGDIVAIVTKLFTGTAQPLPPLWFNPSEQPMTMLIFSIGVGILHLLAGMGLAAYKQIRDGHPLAAFLDVGTWLLFLVSIALFALGVPFGAEIMLGSLLLYVFSSGRASKNIFGKFFMGLKNFYFNLSGYFSDIISYSRIMALALATGIIASVINTMGSLFGNSFIGIIGLTVVFLVGQVFNLGINALGSYVHASRLQYVEFFSKFYESGGKAFAPAAYKAKFVEIKNVEE